MRKTTIVFTNFSQFIYGIQACIGVKRNAVGRSAIKMFILAVWDIDLSISGRFNAENNTDSSVSSNSLR